MIKSMPTGEVGQILKSDENGEYKFMNPEGNDGLDTSNRLDERDKHSSNSCDRNYDVGYVQPIRCEDREIGDESVCPGS